MKRRELDPPLVPGLPYSFVVPAPPATEPELSAYNAGLASAKSDSPSCPNPNMTASERVAFTHGVWAGQDASHLAAPLSWPVEAPFLLAGVLVAQADRSGEPWRTQLLAATPAMFGGLLSAKLKVDLEQRRARDLGLTQQTAPHPSVDCLGVMTFAVAKRLVLRLLGFKYRTAPWPRVLATEVIREINRRRAWNAAIDAATRNT